MTNQENCDPNALADAIVRRQSDYFRSIPELASLFDALPHVQLVINDRRQIVFANRYAVEVLGLDNPRRSYGLFPGELLDCPHAFEDGGRCGTTAACESCGANRTISFANRGERSVQECRILQRRTGRALDLRVSGNPVSVNGESFVVLTLTDISHEKRRQSLERVFFHDLMNLATGIIGYAAVLQRAPQADTAVEAASTIRRLVFQLSDEIKSQRELSEAENNELQVCLEPLTTYEVLDRVHETYVRHELARDRSLIVDSGCMHGTFIGDRVLIGRVLGNLVKNALEAAAPGEQVTMGCQTSDEHVEFHVHNKAVMPRDVQFQVFQRSFSTKGRGRGLGTYSIKLLSERYLAGKAWFTSTPEDGTTFFVQYPRKGVEGARMNAEG